MKNYFDFTGKKYLVTGASSGIGKATAICLAEQGATLVINGRNEERLQQTYQQLKGQGHMSIVADLNQYDDMTGLFQKMVGDGTKLDGFVHCAGIDVTAPISVLDKRSYEEVMNINVYVLLEMVRVFCKRKFHNEQASVVAVSSLSAVAPGKCLTLYSAAKAGMNAAIQAAAQEIVAKKIRINSVMPGFTKTQIYYDIIEKLGHEAVEKLTDQQLLGIPEPEDIAKTIMFLLSDASSMITGRAMYVDSGTL